MIVKSVHAFHYRWKYGKNAWILHTKHHLPFSLTAWTHFAALQNRWGPMACTRMWAFLPHGYIFPVMSPIDLNRYCRIWGTLAFLYYLSKFPPPTKIGFHVGYPDHWHLSKLLRPNHVSDPSLEETHVSREWQQLGLYALLEVCRSMRARERQQETEPEEISGKEGKRYVSWHSVAMQSVR